MTNQLPRTSENLQQFSQVTTPTKHMCTHIKSIWRPDLTRHFLNERIDTESLKKSIERYFSNMKVGFAIAQKSRKGQSNTILQEMLNETQLSILDILENDETRRVFDGDEINKTDIPGVERVPAYLMLFNQHIAVVNYLGRHGWVNTDRLLGYTNEQDQESHKFVPGVNEPKLNGLYWNPQLTEESVWYGIKRLEKGASETLETGRLENTNSVAASQYFLASEVLIKDFYGNVFDTEKF